MINITFESIKMMGLAVQELSQTLVNLEFEKLGDRFSFNVNEQFQIHMKECFNTETQIRNNIILGFIDVGYIDVLGKEFVCQPINHSLLQVSLKFKKLDELLDGKVEEIIEKFISKKETEFRERMNKIQKKN